ncbi:hypothetical protein BDA96_04G094600 [Sorghum bicolor]|uniref:Uncharacterized protein n=1 Tax=Sorghum bicolor TaxID=4558 RepID=A0A921R357_SORBI|nr:hypothetical protein BDA96_04G094600 [Sorghum bicolor]
MNCSAKCGHVAIGSPAATHSSTEFQPQCVTKAPVAGCDRIAFCGAQPVTTSPLSPTRRSKPSSDSHRSNSPRLAGFTAQMNGRSLASSPCAISTSCDCDERTRLPKLTSTTDRDFLDSSHVEHRTAAVSSESEVAVDGMLCWRKRGPTVHTFLPSAAS